MKKCLAILLTAALLLCAAPLAGFTAINWPGLDLGSLFPTAKAAEIVASGNCGAEDDGSNLTWTLDSEGLLTISGSGKMKDYRPGAPWHYYNQYKTVIHVIVIQTGVTNIGAGAFQNCVGLTSVTISDSMTSIGDVAFLECTGLTSVTIPDGVTSIGDSAFCRCVGLTSVTIPNSVTNIGRYAFSGCTGLTSVTIPDGVTSIEDSAFFGCAGLMSVTIPDSVTSIGELALAYCTGLTSVTIPDSVTSIGQNAFEGCTGLTSVTIPTSVTSIGQNAFSGCTGLTNLAVDINNPVYFGVENCIIKKENKTLVVGCKSSIIPADGSVTSIGQCAFTDCTGLMSVTIPDSITNIGDYAFRDCTGMTSVTISDSVTSIGEQAFYNCTGLTSVTIPGSVTSIENYTFYGCTGLTSVTIPDSVTSIGKWAFESCTGLMSVTIPASVMHIGDQAFYGCVRLINLTVDANNPVYFSAGNCVIEKESKTLLFGCKNSVIPSDGSVTNIGPFAFDGCTGLTSVTIPDSITSIGDCAFRDCTELKSVTIPTSVTSIGGDAFYRCAGLASIVIPLSIIEIRWDAIPKSTVIYSYAGSYAQQWAEKNNRVFMVIDDASVTLNVPEIVNEPSVYAYGFATPGVEVVCSVNGKETVTVTASASCRWSTEIPLTGAKEGDSFEIKAAVTVDGATAQKTATVTCKLDAIAFKEFTLNHSYYSFTIKEDNLGVSVPNFTFVPGKPLAFKIKVTNSSRIDRLFIVSTKDGDRKQMELTRDTSGYWFANGFFDASHTNYVPGEFMITGVDKDGDEFDTGVAIKIKFLIDPSGYAYEAVQSNQLEDVTAAVYYKDEAGHELLWNAETADQLNPIKTLSDGAFAWVVPEGQWQVRLYKDGYEDAASDWMDVPPERTNVFIPMVSQNAPEVTYCNIYADRAEITFSQYMNIESVNTDSVTFKGYSSKITPIDKTETAEGSGVFYAKSFTFTPETAFAGEVTVSVSGARNYAGKAMASPYTATFTVAAEPKNLTATDVAVPYGQTAEIAVSAENAAGKTAGIAVSAENAAGKTVSVACDSANITLSAKTLTLDESGKAALTVTGEMPGTANLTFTLDGTTLTAAAKVSVAVPDVPAEPEQPVDPENPATPTDPDHPATPTDPEQPGPATPTDPEHPATPTDPDGPGTATPTDPDGPGTATPTDPEHPATPTDPDGPGTATPTDPDGPGTATPTDPEHPATPTDPDGPGTATPTDPDGPGTATPTDPDQPEYTLGDVDGDGEISSGDARLALRASVQLEKYAPGSAPFLAADVDKNGVIEASDARTILRVSVKLESF